MPSRSEIRRRVATSSGVKLRYPTAVLIKSLINSQHSYVGEVLLSYERFNIVLRIALVFSIIYHVIWCPNKSDVYSHFYGSRFEINFDVKTRLRALYAINSQWFQVSGLSID